MDVAEVSDVWHLLKEGQVEYPGLDEGLGPPDVDRLAPLPGVGVEHVNVSVAVDEQEAVRSGGDGLWLCGIHYLNLPGLPTLQVHIHPETVEDEEELSPRKLYRSKSIYRIVCEEAQHLIVRVDERERMLVPEEAVDREA